jgi:hypothetical protein
MMKAKTKAGGSAVADFLRRAATHSARSAAERRAMLETRRSILRKLLLRQCNTKSGQL